VINKKYIKKPVVIEAVEYERDKNIASCMDFCPDMVYNSKDNEYDIITLEGLMRVTKGDFIIKGVNGEFYPCKPDIFRKTYEEVAISKMETTTARALSCWYCTEIEKHGVVVVKTVLDKSGRELDAYETPYNYCPNCGRRLTCPE
jgi:hypothetical protein